MVAKTFESGAGYPRCSLELSCNEVKKNCEIVYRFGRI